MNTTLDNQENKFQFRKSLKKRDSKFIKIIGIVDNYINRPLAALLVRLVYNTRVTPNGLTYISFVFGVAGAFFISRGEHLYFVLGGVMAQLSSIVDGADGMLARSRNKCSEYGAYLDLFLDRIIDFSLMVGIAAGAGAYFKSNLLFTLGLLTAGLYLLQINLFYIAKGYLQVKQTGETGEFRALMMWGIFLFAVVNRLDIIIYFGLIETAVNTSIRLVHFILLGKKQEKSEK